MHAADGSGRLRLIRRVVTYEGIVDTAFRQVRQHARGNVAIVIRLLEVIAEGLVQPLAPDRHSALRRPRTS